MGLEATARELLGEHARIAQREALGAVDLQRVGRVPGRRRGDPVHSRDRVDLGFEPPERHGETAHVGRRHEHGGSDVGPVLEHRDGHRLGVRRHVADEPADVGKGPHDEVHHARLGRRLHAGGQDLDQRMLEAAAHRHGLHRLENVVLGGRAHGGRLQHADAGRAGGVDADGGQFGEALQRHVATAEGQPRQPGFDAGPQLVGRLQRTVDAVALVDLEPDRVGAGTHHVGGDRHRDDLGVVGRVDLGGHDLARVQIDAQFRRLRQHQHGVGERDRQRRAACGLGGAQIDGPAAEIDLALQPQVRERDDRPVDGRQRTLVVADGDFHGPLADVGLVLEEAVEGLELVGGVDPDRIVQSAELVGAGFC